MSTDPQFPPPSFAPLGPPQSPGPSLEEEERAMRKGRGKMIAFAVVVLVAIIGGGALLLSSSGPSPYSAIGRQVNGMRAEYFDSFWACALPRANLRNIRNNSELADAIHERARFNASQYAQLIRTSCLANLNDHLPQLDTLLPTEDLVGSIEALRTALRSLTQSWTSYLDYLNSQSEGYDAESPEAIEHVQAIVRAWYDYRVALGQINEVVRAHVDE